MPIRNHALVLLLVAFLTFLGAASPAVAAPQRLLVSSNHRQLIRADGKPFFWMADTNWRLYKLTRDEIDHYLDDRKAKLFNVIQGPVLLHTDWGAEPVNVYGETNTDPANPNEQWFEHIDYIVDAAADRGMYVALVVTWGDMWANFSSNNQAKQCGKWLGQRYANRNNVIWIVAGECFISGADSQIIDRWNALGEGLRDGSQGKNLITIHGSYQYGYQSSSVAFHDQPWLDFNMIQSSQGGDYGNGADNWNLVDADWQASPAKPTIDGEANYENYAGWDAFGVRRRAYWSVFAGAFGHTYGANGVWDSYRGGTDDPSGSPSQTWSEALNNPGAGDMKHLRRLMESRPMLKRHPAQFMLLSFADDTPIHVQTTRGGSGRYAMIYIPQAGKQFIVDMGKISGSTAKAWWFNPRTGAATLIGSFPASGVRMFKTPSSGADWVLVLDDKSQGYSKPGTGGPLP